MTIEQLRIDYAGFKRLWIGFGRKAREYGAEFARVGDLLAAAGKTRLGIIGGGQCGAVAFSLLRENRGIEIVGIGDRDKRAARLNFPDTPIFDPTDPVWQTMDALLVAMSPDHYDQVLGELARGGYGGPVRCPVYLMFQAGLGDSPDHARSVVLATLPRSGSYWLAYMLGDLLEHQFGYRVCQIDRSEPEANQLRLLPQRAFTWNHYTVNGLQSWLGDDRFRFIYLYRGLRDQLVSWSRYARNNPESGSHAVRRYFSQFSADEALMLFITGAKDVFEGEVIDVPSLAVTAEGVHQWLEQARVNPLVTSVKYETLVETPGGELSRLIAKMGYSVHARAVDAVVEKYRFEQLSKGRAVGQEDQSAHFRKGIVGDHRAHFAPIHDALVKANVPAHLQYLL